MSEKKTIDQERAPKKEDECLYHFGEDISQSLVVVPLSKTLFQLLEEGCASFIVCLRGKNKETRFAP